MIVNYDKGTGRKKQGNIIEWQGWVKWKVLQVLSNLQVTFELRSKVYKEANHIKNLGMMFQATGTVDRNS